MLVGCDIVVIKRIENIAKRHGQRFLQKILSQKEQNSLLSLASLNYASLAGLYAAKEAASKALGVGISKECGFLDIEISKDAKGSPRLEFSQKTKELFRIDKTSLSISHDGGFAIAVVALTQK